MRQLLPMITSKRPSRVAEIGIRKESRRPRRRASGLVLLACLAGLRLTLGTHRARIRVGLTAIYEGETHDVAPVYLPIDVTVVPAAVPVAARPVISGYAATSPRGVPISSAPPGAPLLVEGSNLGYR